MTAVETPPQLRSSSPSLVLQVLRFRELAIVVAILLVFGVTVLKDPSFANALSIQQLLAGPAIIGLLAVGETLVIVTRNVDLSVGSVLGLSAYLVGDLFVHDKSITIIVALLYGLLIGVGCGLVNGVIVAYARVPSLVVTLGTLYIIRGVTAVIVNGIQINPTSIPQSFLKLGSGTILGIPYIFIITTVAVVVVGYVMRNYRAARDLYAIGSNPEAAVLAGIPVPRRILSAFVISGALAGLGGAIWLAEFATVASTAGSGYELLVVSAVVVGGVAIFGGSGTVLGAALGALLLNTIDQALVASRISSFWNQAIAGAMLLLAISFDRFVSLRAERALRRGEVEHGPA
jgi:rhamnose transport system permease protein